MQCSAEFEATVPPLHSSSKSVRCSPLQVVQRTLGCTAAADSGVVSGLAATEALPFGKAPLRSIASAAGKSECGTWCADLPLRSPTAVESCESILQRSACGQRWEVESQGSALRCRTRVRTRWRSQRRRMQRRPPLRCHPGRTARLTVPVGRGPKTVLRRSSAVSRRSCSTTSPSLFPRAKM